MRSLLPSFILPSFINLICLLSCSLPSVAAELHATRLLDPNHVVEVKIDIPEQNWKKLCGQSRDFGAAFADPTDKPYTYVKANVTIDGVTIKDVGLRKKGFIGSQDSVRPSLKIKFDEYVEQAPIEGMERMTLNNNKQDESLLSQALTYQLFRKVGVHAPRSTFATVTVNGEYLGIYSHVESIKKTFLKNEFGDSTGKLYEGTLADLYEKGIARLEAKGKAADEDRANVTKLAKLLYDEQTALADIEAMVDLNNFLKFWAMESVLGFWDGYTQNQNNYFLYENPSNGKYYFIPWGADSCFVERSPFNFGGGGGFLRAQSVLANRVFHLRGGEDRFRAAVWQILEDVWKEDELLAEITRMEDLLFNDISEQQLKHFNEVKRIRDFISNRREQLKKELAQARLSIPKEPRKPMYAVDLGRAVGSFTTTWREESKPDAAKMALTKDGENKTVSEIKAWVEEGQVRRFGPPRNGPNPEPPIAISVSYESEEESWTATMNVSREEFASIGKKLKVTGVLREGGDYGFGSPMLKGELILQASGMDSGDEIVGAFDVRILKLQGGMMDRRGRR